MRWAMGGAGEAGWHLTASTGCYIIEVKGAGE